ncbi:MAG: hypothetical protein CL920_21575 [Deltaproteobacteria bacterium]|nr:hypothetical protein [Deltaproteobacteria bacterium]MBU51288.1 hypothetical protein [Deltaproteobacteria bacterium]
MDTNKTLGRLERVELRDYWEHEGSDFTPWLASEENIALLSETIGLELEVQQEEAAVGPFRADILCRDTASDELVIIENQLEKTDHKHLGQTITYASGLDAVNIVWIAARFTEEHRAALDWLNRITHEEFRFFGIEIELWRIGKSVPAPKFNIVAKPNDWSKTIKESTSRRGTLTTGQQAQMDYWAGFGTYLEEQQARFKPPKPYPCNWMAWGIGRSGCSMMAIVNAKEIAVRVEINQRKHPTWFEKLQEEREDIESELQFTLTWEERPNNKFSVLSIKNELDTRDEKNHRKAFAWTLKHMSAIDKAFRPRVKELDDTPLHDEE